MLNRTFTVISWQQNDDKVWLQYVIFIWNQEIQFVGLSLKIICEKFLTRRHFARKNRKMCEKKLKRRSCNPCLIIFIIKEVTLNDVGWPKVNIFIMDCGNYWKDRLLTVVKDGVLATILISYTLFRKCADTFRRCLYKHFIITIYYIRKLMLTSSDHRQASYTFVERILENDFGSQKDRWHLVSKELTVFVVFLRTQKSRTLSAPQY